MHFSSSLLLAAVLVAVGALVAFLARSVQTGNVETLAGYDAERVANKAGLAAWAGSNLLVIGFVQIGAGLLSAVYPSRVGIFFFATIGLVARATFGCRRFYR